MLRRPSSRTVATAGLPRADCRRQSNFGELAPASADAFESRATADDGMLDSDWPRSWLPLATMT